MAFQYTKARRENCHLLIGLIGPSGSGKTFSAMQLATGLGDGQPFLVLDSEDRRGLYYADRFDFEHREIKAPFTPAKYRDAVLKGAADGFVCIVVDSISHEWEGEGGVVEMAEADKRKPPGNWNAPKAAHKRMVNGFLQVACNLIVCLRAQEKLDLSKTDDRGKVLVKSLGWLPICEKGFPYELSPRFTLSDLAPGVVDFGLPQKIEEHHRLIFPPGQLISLEAGKVLGQWARGEAIEVPDKELWTSARRAANEGMKSLIAFSNDLPEAEKAKLKPIKEELIATGRRTDKNLEGGVVGENAKEQASEPATKPESKPPDSLHPGATAGGWITEDAAQDLEAMLSERDIEPADFLGKIHLPGISDIRVADLPRVVSIIENWT